MKVIYYLLVFFFVVLNLPQTNAQSISNEGLEFWTVFPTHDPSNNDLATMNVIITSKNDSEVTITCGLYSEKKTIRANRAEVFLVPRNESYIDANAANTVLANKGIHILVSPGKPKVVAYSHVYAGYRSAATLILPFEALGQSYFSMNYSQDNGGKNYMVFVAAEDLTNIVLNKKDGTKEIIKLLKKGDVYEYMPAGNNNDLTGTYVEVEKASSECKRFAAFSGSTSIAIGTCQNLNGRDPLLQQLYAVNSWGKNYGVVPFLDRRFIIRVLAQESETKVFLNGASIGVIGRGNFLEIPLTESAIITSDKLISVAQYAYSQNCSSINGTALNSGDPEMVILNPIEFNIKNITVFSSNQKNITERYINAFMKTDKTSSFRVNGALPSSSWKILPGNTAYSYLQLQVYEESLTLTANDGFNAIAYGFGQTESYAYSAGTNLASSSSLKLVNQMTNLENEAACLGQATDFKLTVPYLLDKVTWTFSDGTTFIDPLDKAPVLSTDAIGNQLYTYVSVMSKIFTSPGGMQVKAVAIVANSALATACFDGADLEFNFEVEVSALAVPDFDAPSDVCLGSKTIFVDKSIGNPTKWRWEIDGEIIEEQNPTYEFTSLGNHTIKLAVANQAGCWSDVISKTINIRKYLPKITFNPLPPVCVNDPEIKLVAFESLGLTAAEKVFSGKGVHSLSIFNPADAGPGIHEITYTFKSTDGCVNTITRHIEVYDLPKLAPINTVYIFSGGQKEIPAKILNPSAKQLIKWSPSEGLSRDDILNPIASPSQTTEYVLTVTVEGMCEMTTKVLVKVLEEVQPPNAFSPNGDGINDFWEIKSLDSYPNATVVIMNRNGQKVFSSLGYSVPFNGTYKNEPLPVGVYYYIISPNNGRKAITGALTIIK